LLNKKIKQKLILAGTRYSMITAQNLKKNYGSLEVLKGVDLKVEKGEIISIVGASGAGKTTLLQILGTLDTVSNPETADLQICGVDVLKLKSKEMAAFRNKHLGFVFQFHQLLPEFTAIENVCIPAFIAQKSKKEAFKEAEKLLDFLGLADRKLHKPGELSGGEQQRVAVARALINKPDVVFADEPSGNLDSASAEKLHQLFFQLQKELGQTFVIVTHNEKLANMADRKLTMKDGKMIS
jgi:lipoprotein-releasing system ATP-binding protein